MVSDKQRQFFNYVFKRALDSSRENYGENDNFELSNLKEYYELRNLIYNAIQKIELKNYTEYGDTIIVDLSVYIKPVEIPQRLYDYVGEKTLEKIVSIALLGDFEMHVKKYLGQSLRGKLTLYMVKELIEV